MPQILVKLWWVTLVLLGVVVAAGAAQAPDLDTRALRALLQGGQPPPYLLDVRTEGEFRQGRLQGSVLIPMNQLARRLAEVPRDRKVVVVCATGARSAAVARYLGQQGFSWVANYADGLMGWARAGLPVVR